MSFNWNSEINNQLVIGADIGGTHITTGRLQLLNNNATLSAVKRASVNAGLSAAEIITGWTNAVHECSAKQRPTRLCMAMPGPFDYEKGISLINEQRKYQALYQLNVKHALAEALSISPDAIFLKNDAACFLSAEILSNANHLSGNEKLVGITLGTGLGTAIFENGITRSADRWDMPFGDSFAEEYLSTRWFCKRYYEMTGIEIKGARELMQRWPGDPLTKNIFKEYGANLANFIRRFATENQASVVIVGGNISRAWPAFGMSMENGLRDHSSKLTVLPALHFEDGAALGAIYAAYTEKNSLS